MDLWQRLWQDRSNSCYNTVLEWIWLGGSVSNRNRSGKTAAKVAEKTRLTGPVGSGGREAEEISRKQRWRRCKLCLEATAGWRRSDNMMAATATVAAQIWICGRGCVKISATAVTTRWQSELGLLVASEIATEEEGWQKQWGCKLGLLDLSEVVVERRQKHQDINYGGGANLAWQGRQGGGEATARQQ